jgi:hypothetical protein
MKHEQLLKASQSAVVIFTLLISREGLSQEKKDELKTTYLRSNGYKLISQHNLFLHRDGIRKFVKEQALIECYKESIQPLASEIIKDMEHNEELLLGLLPAEEGNKC